MRILIGCDDFSRRTGMPIYLLTLSRELIRRGHEVAIVSFKIGLASPEEISQHEYGAFISSSFSPDVLLLNEPRSARLLDLYPDVPAYNIIHSPREEDAPIMRRPQVRKYISVKEQDYGFIRSKGIDQRFIAIIPSPVDLKHFKPINAEIKWDIASISTIDAYRRPMLLKLLEYAKTGKRVLIAGEDFGSLKDQNPEDIKNLTFIPKSIADVRPYIAQSAVVAGIFNGLISVEAQAMGKETWIFDADGEIIKAIPPLSKKDILKHDVKNVVDEFLKLFTQTWADIVIPHHDRDDLLKGCLESIPKMNFNVIVSKGNGTFAKNCNAGARQAKTEKLIFLNDDTVVNPRALWTMVDAEEDVVGCRQTFPKAEHATALKQCIGITLKRNPKTKVIQYWLTDDPEDVLYPSGAIFKISKDLFWKIGGFDEQFRNGGEDQDLFLKSISAGGAISFCMVPIIHFLSQSKGRFDHVEECDKLFWSRWTDEKLKEIWEDL